VRFGKEISLGNSHLTKLNFFFKPQLHTKFILKPANLRDTLIFKAKIAPTYGYSFRLVSLAKNSLSLSSFSYVFAGKIDPTPSAYPVKTKLATGT